MILRNLIPAIRATATRQPVDPASVPGFRHRAREPEYARLALPFCRRDSIGKLAVLLEDEVDRVR